MEIYSTSVRIQSNYERIWTRKSYVFKSSSCGNTKTRLIRHQEKKSFSFLYSLVHSLTRFPLYTYLFTRSMKKCKLQQADHCLKSIRIWSFSSPYFLVLRFNMEIYFLSGHIQSECGEMRTRKTPNTDTFQAVD